MPLTIHHRAQAADFDFAVVGRGTLCVRSDKERLAPGSYRALLSRLDHDEKRLSLSVVQAAFYLPYLISFQNPMDIAGAATSYAMRHPRLRAVYVVAPQRGLVSLVIDLVVRHLPGLDTRFLRDPAAATALLRPREPDLPGLWQDLPLEARETVSS